jgi:uncharacterized membrane protein YebE (DUF533 family)
MKTSIKKTFLALMAFGALGLGAGAAQAGWYHDRPGPAIHAHKQSQFFLREIHERLDRQISRIDAGARQGSLTGREYRELMREHDDIRAMVRHFRADGFIDPREFQRVERALDVASRNIKFEKHDRQGRHDHAAWNHYPWYR